MTTIAVLRVKGGKIAVAITATLLLALAALALDASPAFAADPTLTVSRTGGGTVTSNPTGIDCGTDCSEAYPITFERVCETIDGRPVCSNEPVYQDVTLTASTPSGWSFAGWGGACSGTATTCTLTMDSDMSVSATFTDVQNPSVSLTSPTGPYVSGTINVQATASDNDRVSSVQFFVGSTFIGTDTTAPYGVSFNTVGHDGSRTIRAVATDFSGRTAESSRAVMVDNTPPTVNVTGGPNGQTFGPGSTQTWTYSVGDAASGIASVQCSVVATGSPASFGPCSGGATSHSVSNRPEGNYTFTVRARDNVGHEMTQSRTFSIDATAPNTQIDSGSVADGGATNQTSLTFNFSASEPGSTFQCRVYPAALTPPAFGDCSGSGTHTASGFSPGTYNFQVRATDQVGNVGDPATRSFTVDTTAPTVLDNRNSLEPDSGKTGVSRTTNVSATFSEEMKAGSLTSTTFKLQMYNTKKKRWVTVPTTLTLSNANKTATLDPYGATEGTTEKPLAANKKFRGFITTGVKDLAGNPLASKFIWTFTTRT